MSKQQPINQLTRMTKAQENALRNVADNPSTKPFLDWLLHQTEFMQAVSCPEMLSAQGLGFDIFEALGHIDPHVATNFMRDHFIGIKPEGKQESEGAQDDG